MSEPVGPTVEGGAPVAQAPAQASRPRPAIRVRHLWHRFGTFDVLRDVTFDVAEGEIFGFIGPNGAGKTTTIRVMTTLLEPMAGRVEVDGIDVSLNPYAVRRLIGYMPDHAGVYDRVTVREYLEFFADAFRVPSADVVDAVLELTELRRIQDRVVATMSKGMKQRLQLGRILLHDPKVLILDEPASDLDPRARIEIRDLLLELRSLGKTVFLSSHILTELSDVCTSIGILERGRLVVAGPIGEIGARLEAIRAAQAIGHHPPPNAPHGHAPHGRAPHGHAPHGHAPYGHLPPGHAPPAPYPAVNGAPPPAYPGAPGQTPPPGPSMVPGHAAVPGHAVVPGHPPAPGVPLPVAIRRKVKVKVLGDAIRAAYFLRGGPGIIEVEVIAGLVHVTFEGGEVKIAEIVQHLVRNGVGVVGVEPERNELERIFLEVTRGEVQ
ncbi:ABC transporter ATP-binding protein [Chondromyces crocatus]|uniref:ABC transporter domain-containing protein n=1 Tax=Chondromyces crocatus TaxID=52 RepID=A0A0K1E9A8_CHOCO|nr:ABC transporter ATP-binding protein [Chondromyces crocatus]AKT37153.1 uncharacterized protein CMC5_012830 [Chondromyces crocatus]